MISSVLNHLTGLFGTLHHRLVNLRQLPLLTILHRQFLDVAFHEAGIMVFLATSCRVFSALRLISSSGVTYMSWLTSLLLLFLSTEKSPILYQFAQEKHINLIFLRLSASDWQIFCIFASVNCNLKYLWSMKTNRFCSTIVLLLFSVILGHAQQLKFMGIPLCSDLSQYEEVLKAKRFRDKYPSGDLAHRCWDGGDFWKVSRCYL